MLHNLYQVLRFNTAWNMLTLSVLFVAALFAVPLFETAYGADEFLFIHTILELLSVLMALSIFTIVWLMWEGFDDYCGKFVLLFGLSFFAVGVLDTMHTLSYEGMPPFITANSPEKSIFFWLFARYLVILGLLVAFLWPKENGFCLRKALYVLGGLAAVSIAAALLGGTVFLGSLPLFYQAATGITSLKIILEYVLTFLYIMAGFLLWNIRAKLTQSVLRNLLYFLLFSAFAEITLASYENVYDTYSILGHMFKMFAYFSLFKAVYLAGVVNHFYTLGEMGKMSAELLKEEISVEAVLEIQMPKLKKLIPQAEQICVHLIANGGSCYRTVYSWGKFSELFPVGGEFKATLTNGNAIGLYTEPASLLPLLSEEQYTPAVSVILKASQQMLRMPLVTKEVLHGVILLFIFNRAGRFTPAAIEKAKVFQQFATLAIAQAASQETIRKLSYEDSLTGLPNRRWFFSELSKIKYDADEHGMPFTVVYLDMNGLKYINDHLGHEAGDKALAVIGQALAQTARGSDLAARLGGDEFTLLLRHMDMEEGLLKVSELKEAFARLPLVDYDHHFSLAVGGASYPAEGSTLEQILSLADDRMFEHKRQLKAAQTNTG